MPLILGPAEGEAALLPLLLLVMGEGAGSMMPTVDETQTHDHIGSLSYREVKKGW